MVVNPAQDIRTHLQQLGAALRRRKGLVSAVTLSGGLLVGIGAFWIPPSYTATVQIEIEPRPPLPGVAQPAAAEPADEPAIDTHVARLSSDALLSRVRGNFSNRSTPEPSAGQPLTLRWAIEGLQSWLRTAMNSIRTSLGPLHRPEGAGQEADAQDLGIAELKRSLKVRQERRSRIIAVVYTDPSAEGAAAIANEIAKSHVENLREEARSEAERLLGWIESHLTEAEAEYEQAENAVRSYRATHIVPDGETATHALAIAEASQQLALAKSASDKQQAALERIRKEQSGETRTAHFGEINEIARQLEHEVHVVRSQAQSMEQYLEALRGASSDSYRQKAELEALELRAASSAKLYDELKRRKQAAMQQRDAFQPEARIIAPALKPESPSSPSPLLLIPASLIASLLFGAGVALALDRLDTRFRTKRDVAEALGISCIGLVPEIRPRSTKITECLIKNLSPVYFQAVQSLVVSILKPSLAPRAPKVILLTSSSANEGKSTLALSMAFCAARLRRRVLLINFDPPSTHAREQVHVPENGVKNLTPIGALTTLPELGFDCIMGRGSGAEPLDFLLSGQFHKYLSRIREEYDCVILDSPPVLSTIDARVLAPMCDTVIFTIRWEGTERAVAAEALELLEQVSVDQMAAVLTRVKLKGQYLQGSRCFG